MRPSSGMKNSDLLHILLLVRLGSLIVDNASSISTRRRVSTATSFWIPFIPDTFSWFPTIPQQFLNTWTYGTGPWLRSRSTSTAHWASGRLKPEAGSVTFMTYTPFFSCSGTFSLMAWMAFRNSFNSTSLPAKM